MGEHDSNRYRAWVLGWILLGVVLRLAVVFPEHWLSGEADCVGVGICAFEVLEGEMPVFYSGYRLGSLASHLSAPVIWLFGPGRLSLTLVAAAVWCLFLVVGHLMQRELLGDRLAFLGLPFLVVPSSSVVFWTYRPIGYAESMLLCATMLWLAGRLARRGDEWTSLLGLGLAAGLGWWNNMLTVACSAPAVLWLLWRRPRLAVRPWAVALAASGFTVGALPWLAFNLRYHLWSLRGELYTAPASGTSAMIDNLHYLVFYRLRELVAPLDFANGVDSTIFLFGPLSTLVVGLGCLALVVFLLWPLLGRRFPDLPPLRPAYFLYLAIFAAVLALNVSSGAGSLRGPTVRYVLPLFLLLPGVLALATCWIGLRWRSAAIAFAVAVLGLHLVSTPFFFTERHRQWQERAAGDETLLRWLDDERIDAVVGPYWQTYPITYFTGRDVVAVPIEAAIDRRFRVSVDLGPEPRRWAFLTNRWSLDARWSRKRTLAGTEPIRVGPYFARIFESDESGAALRDRLVDEPFEQHLPESP